MYLKGINIMDSSLTQPMVPLSAIHTLSRPTSPLVTAGATLIKNLQIAFRYLPNMAGTFVEMAVRAAFFFLMSNVISLRGRETAGLDLTGRNLFIFFLGSLILYIFTRSTLWGPINAVTNDLYNGTLEYLYSNPSLRYAYYVGTVLAEVTTSLGIFLPIFTLLVIYARVNLNSLLLVLLACVIVLTALTAMGIMIALLALIWRQVGSVASVLGILFEMLAGAYLPISAFPQPVQYLAYFLPFTWSYDLIRYYSFAGAWTPILPVTQEWIILGSMAVIFTLASRYLLHKTEMLAKKSGLHTI
jgi:ABC-2 type transport system permease protein